MKPNLQGYQCARFASPVSSWKKLPPIRNGRLARSIACATLATGGKRKKRGKTVHSFASSSGIAAIPVVTWIPCVTR